MSEEARTCVEILKKAARFGVADCQYCPAYSVCPTGTAGWDNECMLDTAADLIESLSEQLEQVTRERDAYLKCIEGLCATCKHAPYCILTPIDRCKCWEWKGVEVEG